MYEFLFALFLCSYQFKNAAFIPAGLDLTIVTALILLPYTIAIMIVKRRHLSSQGSSWFSLAFALYAVLSLQWGYAEFFITQKTMIFTIFTIPALLIARYIIARESNRLRNFFYSVLFLATLTTAEAYRVLFTSPADIVTLLGNNYLVAGKTLGLGILLALGLVDSSKKWFNYIVVICISAMFVVSFYLGGRGPVISLIIAIMLWAWISYRKADYIKPVPIVLFVISSCGFWLLLNFKAMIEQSVLIKRMGEIVTADGTIDQSIILRWEYYQSAWQAFIEHPLQGIGLGSWPQYFGMGDVYWHPHNMLLEILSELGVIGLTLFSATIWEMQRQINWREVKLSPTVISLSAALLFSIMNAIKSGDLNDNAALFVMFGLLAGVLTREMYDKTSTIQTNHQVKT